MESGVSAGNVNVNRRGETALPSDRGAAILERPRGDSPQPSGSVKFRAEGKECDGRPRKKCASDARSMMRLFRRRGIEKLIVL
jgi:hypothetical protein